MYVPHGLYVPNAFYAEGGGPRIRHRPLHIADYPRVRRTLTAVYCCGYPPRGRLPLCLTGGYFDHVAKTFDIKSRRMDA